MKNREFQALFKREASVHAFAHGRVNLIGEHTDYNGGYVLPSLIPQSTIVQMAPRRDWTVRLGTSFAGETGFESYELGFETPGRGWIDYAQGLTYELARNDFEINGFDAWIDTTIPVGSGLASSAALEIALLRAICQTYGLSIPDMQMALLAQRAENDFVGAKVGIMDQATCTLCTERHALFLDTRELSYRQISLPEKMGLIVIDSGISHENRAGGYNLRRKECEEASRLLGCKELRDATESDLERIDRLPHPLDRRARHVITENQRVLKAVACLEKNDLPALGAIFFESHFSLRDDYEVSLEPIDLLVEIARDYCNIYGARLTGGGFGGCVVILTSKEQAQDAANKIAGVYASRTGLTPRVLLA